MQQGISGYRHRRADADSRRLLDLLIPHVQTALEVRRVLGAGEERPARANRQSEMVRMLMTLPRVYAPNT